MSDYEDEFMCDEDEDYDLEYSEDSNSEPDVDLENQYYNSKVWSLGMFCLMIGKLGFNLNISLRVDCWRVLSICQLLIIKILGSKRRRS